MFEPNMAVFWDIGEPFSSELPPELHNRIARWQMCKPAPADTAIPDQWKANVIEKKEPVRVQSVYGGVGGSSYRDSWEHRTQKNGWLWDVKLCEYAYYPELDERIARTPEQRKEHSAPPPKPNPPATGSRRRRGYSDELDPLPLRIDEALMDIVDGFRVFNMEFADLEEFMEAMDNDEGIEMLVDACKQHSVVTSDIIALFKQKSKEIAVHFGATPEEEKVEEDPTLEAGSNDPAPTDGKDKSSSGYGAGYGEV
jgi:hypothetical protein